MSALSLHSFFVTFFCAEGFAFVQLFVAFVALGTRHQKYFASIRGRGRGVGGSSLGIEGVSVGGSLKVSVHVNFVCACEKCENF